jgi:putative Mg2+ transporter-C (MgtC) family protein
VDLIWFALDVLVAMALGMLIGLERQFHRHPAGLRTNALVCVGAALFVSLSRIGMPDASPTRIAAQVVSGIGFLGAGVIFREGVNVRGMNTAATLWCSAAVGVLVGAGFPAYGLIGTMAVVVLHLGLRPLSRTIDARLLKATDVDTFYRLRISCDLDRERVIRTIVLRHVSEHPRMTLQRISTEDTDDPNEAVIVADVFSPLRIDREMEALLSRINIEPSVNAVSWENNQDHASE